MLTTDCKFLHPNLLENRLPAILRGLADDIERLQSGIGPTRDQLDAAPMLIDWCYRFTPLGVRLLGTVVNHPRLSSGQIMTSQIWAADPGGTWARSMSRYYRLGEQFLTVREQAVAMTDDFRGRL